MKRNERKFGYDLIRTIAIMLVPMIHAYAYINVLDQGVLGVKWTLYLALHYLTLTCVPLFMLLSGALMRKKTLSKDYYAGLLRILIPYVVISLIAIAAVWYKTGVAPGFFGAVGSILGFSAIGYAWYVEMYIGLFLLIPFMNMAYNALERKGKHILLFSLLFITAMPSFLKGIWTSLDILPDYWTALYPITYYFLGAYLDEYKPRIPKWCALIGLLLSLALPTAINYAHSYFDGVYAWYVMNCYDSISTVMIALFIWLLFADIENAPKPVSAIACEISVCSFEMYLISYLSDGFLYNYLDRIASVVWKTPVPIYAVMTASVFLLSYFLARLLRIFTVPFSNFVIEKIRGK